MQEATVGCLLYSRRMTLEIHPHRSHGAPPVGREHRGGIRQITGWIGCLTCPPHVRVLMKELHLGWAQSASLPFLSALSASGDSEWAVLCFPFDSWSFSFSLYIFHICNRTFSLLWLFGCFCLFEINVSLCRLCWLGIHFVDQADLQFTACLCLPWELELKKDGDTVASFWLVLKYRVSSLPCSSQWVPDTVLKSDSFSWNSVYVASLFHQLKPHLLSDTSSSWQSNLSPRFCASYSMGNFVGFFFP